MIEYVQYLIELSSFLINKVNEKQENVEIKMKGFLTIPCNIELTEELQAAVPKVLEAVIKELRGLRYA